MSLDNRTPLEENATRNGAGRDPRGRAPEQALVGTGADNDLTRRAPPPPTLESHARIHANGRLDGELLRQMVANVLSARDESLQALRTLHVLLKETGGF